MGILGTISAGCAHASQLPAYLCGCAMYTLTCSHALKTQDRRGAVGVCMVHGKSEIYQGAVSSLPAVMPTEIK